MKSLKVDQAEVVFTDPESYRLVPTRLQESLGDGTTRCHLCPWRCRLRHGQRGFCQAHVNRDGVLYNLGYGIVSAIDIGSIEEKPVRHFQPGTRVLSIGGYGCSFRCTGCHNLEISWGEQELDLLARGESTRPYVSPQKIVEAAIRHGCGGIAFTYSEPAIWMEYVLDVCAHAHSCGLYTVYVSNSFITGDALRVLQDHIDVMCSDIKSMDDGFYKGICGKAGISDVLDSLMVASGLGFHVETRTNIIPTRNDSPGNIAKTAEWIRENLGAESPWHLTRFFPAYQLSHLPPTPVELLQELREVALEAGLVNVYTYADQGCDCASENLPVTAYLDDDPESILNVKKCSASCCGEQGVLLRKYEEGRI